MSRVTEGFRRPIRTERSGPPTKVEARGRGLARLLCCILASAMLACAAKADAGAPFQSEDRSELRALVAPRAVRFRLADGVAITGMLTAWSEEGMLGSFGYRRWTDLRPTDLSDLRSRLMDREDAGAWVALGRTLLGTPGGAGLAEQAFRKARQLDPMIGTEVDDARREAAAAPSASPDPDVGRLRLDEPESRLWQPTPWKPMSSPERDAAVEILRQDADAVLSLARLPAVPPVESDHFIVYWDAPREEVARLALRLERTMELVSKALTSGGGPAPSFWGKALVLVANDRDGFRRLQQRVFFQLDRPDRSAMCHCIGAKVVLVALAGPRGDDLASRLSRELAFGLLHRHISPVRLPPWANEGFAEVVAARSAPEYFEIEARRRAGLRFLREGGDLAALFAATYSDPAWPGPPIGNAGGVVPAGPPIGRLAVELMLRDRPAAFAEWVAAVKRGEEWQAALPKHFGATPAKLVRTVVEHHRFAD